MANGRVAVMYNCSYDLGYLLSSAALCALSNKRETVGIVDVVWSAKHDKRTIVYDMVCKKDSPSTIIKLTNDHGNPELLVWDNELLQIIRTAKLAWSSLTSERLITHGLQMGGKISVDEALWSEWTQADSSFDSYALIYYAQIEPLYSALQKSQDISSKKDHSGYLSGLSGVRSRDIWPLEVYVKDLFGFHYSPMDMISRFADIVIE